MTTLVLALNPSIDAEWRVDDVRWEEKNNVHSERRWAGGKGVNVGRWLKYLGGQPQLILPLGGKTGEELAGCLREEKLPARIIPLREPTRVNVIVTTNAGRQMRFNPPGPKLSGGEWQRIISAVERYLAAAALASSVLLVLSGSLPRGVPVTAYAQLLGLANRFGVRTLLDCEGAALVAAVKARPFLVKPNEHELGNWWGKPLRAEREVVRAAQALSKETRGWVLVSRGAKRSLLINVAENFQMFARPPRVQPRNTVGAGDASVAAVAHQLQRGAPPERWLAAGLAAGTAATQCPPGHLPSRRWAGQ